MTENGEDALTAEQLGAVLEQEGDDAPSMRQTMEAAFDRIEAGEEIEETEAAPDQKTDPEAAPQEDADQAETGEPDQQAIDASGNESPDGEPAEFEAPTSWSDAEKAEFGNLPPDVQKTVARRESDRDKALLAKTQELAETRKGFEDLDAVVRYYRPYHANMGLTPADAVQRLFAVEHKLQTAPVEERREVFLGLAKSYGIDLITAEPAGDGFAPDPAISNLETQVSGLANQLSTLTTSQQQSQAAQAQSAIQTFVESKNEDGSLKYPHFETVRAAMRTLITSAQVATLEEAYDAAVWQNPQLRASLIEGEREKATNGVEKKAASQKAKRGAKVNVSSDATGRAGKAAPKTIRESLERRYDELEGAA